MPQTAFYNGKLLVTPQVTSKLDTSKLANAGLLASGIVGVIGEAIGGEPGVVHRITNYAVARDLFVEGNLLDAINFLFNPSTDPAISGAQEILAVKVNPSTQSSLSLANTSAVDVIVLASNEYGPPANELKVTIADGTDTGKKITVAKVGKDSEVYDNVGGSNAAGYSIDYTGEATACTLTINNTATSASFSVDQAGLDNGTSCNPSTFDTGEKAIIVSDAEGDTSQTVTIYGVNGSTIQNETLSLNGMTPVTGTLTYTAVYGAIVSAAHTGTVSVADQSAHTVFTMATGTNSVGVWQPWVGAGTGLPIEGTIVLTPGGATTKKVLLIGKDASGAAASEVLTLNGTNPITSTTVWSRLDKLFFGAVASATTVTLSGYAIYALHSVYTTLTKLKAHFDAWGGFSTTILSSSPDIISPQYMDFVVATNINTTGAVTFYYNMYAMVEEFNNKSSYIAATRTVSGVTSHGTIANIAATPLTGGVYGDATNTSWDDAIELFKAEENAISIGPVLCLSSDYTNGSGTVSAATVREYVRLFVNYQVGKAESNTWIGLPMGTKAAIKTNINLMNNRNVTCVAQSVDRINSKGVMTTFEPWALACLGAGMQAGSQVGEPQTNKYLAIADLTQDSSWSPNNDSDEMILASLCFAKKTPIGYKFVRGVTSYRQDSNAVYSETSTNAAANYVVRNWREQLKNILGNKAISGTAGRLLSISMSFLSRMSDLGIVVGGIDPDTGATVAGYRNLSVAYADNLWSVSGEISPVEPINFVAVNVALTQVNQAA